MKHALLILAALTGTLSAAASQSPIPTFPAGHHEYLVRGVYMGEPMAPWATEFTLSDTIIAGARASVLLNEVFHATTGGHFTLSAIWKAGTHDPLEAHWINQGREPNACHLTRNAGRISGSINPGGALDTVQVNDNAVPDFAAGAYLATQRLSDGDTIRLTLFRCLPYFGAKAIVIKQLVATVRSDSVVRAGAPGHEPVWVVEGASTYPMKLSIAKADRQLLRFKIPEGDVGEQTAYYLRTRYKQD